MKCPSCSNELPDLTIVCPFCNTYLTKPLPNTYKPKGESISLNSEEQIFKKIIISNNAPNDLNESVKEKKDNLFFIMVILIGLVILASIILLMFINPLKKNKDEVTTTKTTTTEVSVASNNKGYKSTYDYPLEVGKVTLASIYDNTTNKYTDVDVTGIRFIKGTEALELANLYSKEILNSGFEWNAFEYKVNFNDLSYLNENKISPVLNAEIYKWNGSNFITYNGVNYFLNITTIYLGDYIKNNEEATIKILYQLPINEQEYSICFGEIDKTFGCFANS